MTENLPAKECPRCGNLDYYDGFVVMKCSGCSKGYMAYLARDANINN